MKKIVLGLITLFSFAFTQNANAQFSFTKDTVSGYASDGGLELHNNITNSGTSTIRIAWRIMYHNLPSSGKWNTSFGLCDNHTCYNNFILPGTWDTTDAITASSVADFHVAMGDLSGVSTWGPYYVTAELKQVGGSFSDTVTFVMNKYPTSVANTNKANEIMMYPNPAHGELNVVFEGVPDVRNIAVYNLIGKVVSVYRVTDNNSAKLDVDNLPSGIYFLRLNDGLGRVIATRKFTHQ